MREYQVFLQVEGSDARTVVTVKAEECHSYCGGVQFLKTDDDGEKRTVARFSDAALLGFAEVNFLEDVRYLSQFN